MKHSLVSKQNRYSYLILSEIYYKYDYYRGKFSGSFFYWKLVPDVRHSPLISS